MDTYEYRAKRVALATWGTPDSEMLLNAEGAEGWQLVSTVVAGDAVVVVMMRAKRGSARVGWLEHLRRGRPGRSRLASTLRGHRGARGGRRGSRSGSRVAGVIVRDYVGAGTLAEHLSVPAAGAIVAIPDGIDDIAAAAIGHAGSSALLVVDAAELQAGQTVLVDGATGGVGPSRSSWPSRATRSSWRPRARAGTHGRAAASMPAGRWWPCPLVRAAFLTGSTWRSTSRRPRPATTRRAADPLLHAHR